MQFVVTIPAGFERDLARGERPALLIEADATDPSATGNALAALSQAIDTALAHDLTGPLSGFDARSLPRWICGVHRRYNPEGITAYNIVPGLLGVILTMTMVLMTGLAMTRERERGTLENLLATPALPIEVMTGKIVPYIMIGLIQVTLVLLAARYIFSVPMQGNLVLLYAGVLIFIAANLTLGITFSTLARNQLQAMQMTFFFFLPSMLLSGFMFPFRGMPQWAQWIGEVLPLTHFLRIVRGILLKGKCLRGNLWPSLWPILLFMLVVMALGLEGIQKDVDWIRNRQPPPTTSLPPARGHVSDEITRLRVARLGIASRPGWLRQRRVSDAFPSPRGRRGECEILRAFITPSPPSGGRGTG